MQHAGLILHPYQYQIVFKDLSKLSICSWTVSKLAELSWLEMSDSWLLVSLILFSMMF